MGAWLYQTMHTAMGLAGGAVLRPACPMQEAQVDPSFGRTDPLGEGNGNPIQYSRLKSHRQRSLAAYSPSGLKSDATGSDCAAPQALRIRDEQRNQTLGALRELTVSWSS